MVTALSNEEYSKTRLPSTYGTEKMGYPHAEE
jgi:hypothetical protein